MKPIQKPKVHERDRLNHERPVPVRLREDQLARLKTIADREQRSMAAVCRLAVLKGIEQYERTGALI